MSVAPPNSREAEESVVGLLMTHPDAVAAVIGNGLSADDFYHPHARVLFEQITEHFYADERIDPVVVSESVAPKLAQMYRSSRQSIAERVMKIADAVRLDDAEAVHERAKLLRRHAASRALLRLSTAVESSVENGDDPQGIAGRLTEEAMRVATGNMLTSEVESYGDVGRDFVRTAVAAMRARQRGVDIGVHFGQRFIDGYTNGIRGSELLFLAGEPGVGKSILAWSLARSYAQRQATRPEGERIGTLVLSLEMAQEPTAIRLAQMLTRIDGQRVRRGDVAESDVQRVAQAWAAEKDLGLFFNFASIVGVSALRAMVSDAVRKFNVGLVVIDHFGYLTMDRAYTNTVQEDEDKARFLKENLAKDLDVAVLCLAHTTKGVDTESGRPELRHLRGSGQIGAHADFVCFLHRPWLHASDTEKRAGGALRTRAELIFAKNRHGAPGVSEFKFDPEAMQVSDPTTPVRSIT